MPSSPEAPQQGSISTYHLYPENEHSILISPHQLPIKPRKRRKFFKENPEVATDPNGFFVHKPYISFHRPPRTLRQGSSKQGTPICLIHNSVFWKLWNLQFGEDMVAAIDPRGAVSWNRRSNPDNRVDNGDDLALKGYKVRTWRLWRETGKQYHRDVNAKRKQKKKETKAKANKEDAQQAVGHSDSDPDPDEGHLPARADEALALCWIAPLSTRTRCYQWKNAGVDLAWKGTRDLPEELKWSKRYLPWHHLKLTARVPSSSDHSQGEAVLAHYFSGVEKKKYGILVIYKAEVSRVFGHTPNAYVGDTYDYDSSLSKAHEAIVATAVCMVVGEQQKRNVVYAIFKAIRKAAEDGGG
ncbi:uncharacterized protein P174DRAFT_440413 [Aspergillus novofumigatus IBT 16806]|uniref:Uncharacterized protein n=1 Tax=Aspergillus novofumigatus (strain IBT 16806) TaxID=1392255 RepID=A0A2I1CDU0_ASPN1|nr:uncharacterized protein P174DRAFT_440413 [Aspergillus novofumigatus IBT 16806]PKX95800.1 hypothetical protein P174DRAFT_440413 [Aspergillus novofumigatus IBT 16806]